MPDSFASGFAKALPYFCLLVALLFSGSSLALNAQKPVNGPPTGQCMRTVGYWGQNSVGLRLPRDQWEKELDQYCKRSSSNGPEGGNWDIISVSFLHIFYNGNPPLPGLNFAYHCEAAPYAGYPYLLQCPRIGQSIRNCQQAGKIVLLSMGGAVSQGKFENDQQAREYAELLWNMFLGGPNPEGLPKPFGDGISFDGIDLNIEGGGPVGYGSFVKRLRELYATDPNKVYYIGGAPQCPFPDAYLGPSTSNSVYSGPYALDEWLDFIFIQFYNNYCGIQTFGTSSFNFDTWNQWAQQSKTLLFLGVPGESWSGGGYQPASTVQQILQDTYQKYSPINGGWFAGMMVWDIGSAEANIGPNSISFAEQLSSFLKSLSKQDGVSCSGPGPTTSSTASITSTQSSSTATSVTSSTSPVTTASSTTSISSSSTTSSSPTPTSVGCDYKGPESTGPGGIFYKLPDQTQQIVYGMTSTSHLNPAIFANKSNMNAAIDAIMGSASYDDPSLWKPESNQQDQCSILATREFYANNPTQLFVGKPAVGSKVRISNTDINIRLLDKWFAMMLGYSLDQYGTEPHALMALAAKESFATAVQAGNVQDEQREFLAKDPSVGYLLTNGEHYGLGTDGNRDGPFQVEKFSMATSVSIFPGRFKLNPSSTQPSFVLDVTIAQSGEALDKLHSYWVENIYRAVVLTSLDFHWRYNGLLLVPGMGMRVPWDRRYQTWISSPSSSNYASVEQLEFGASMYAYNRGIYGALKSKLCSCQPNMDPITECGLDGFGGHGGQIRSACSLLNQASEIYDFPITFADVEKFLSIMETTFPYSSDGARGLYAKIDWTEIKSLATTAFQQISDNRSQRGGVQKSQSSEPEISFRFDWRLMLAVIRSQLPARESLVGPTWKGMVDYSFGIVVASDPEPNFNSGSSAFDGFSGYISVAGNNTGYVPSSTTTTTTTTTASSTSSSVSSTAATSTSTTKTSSSVTSASTSSTMTSSSTSSLSSSTSSTSTTTASPTIIPGCFCPAENGFVRTRAPGYATKNCESGKFGVIMRTCSNLPDGSCEWGQERDYCTLG